MPIDSRIVESSTPIFWRISAATPEWVMRLDDVADPQCIDVDPVPHRESACGLFVDDLGKPVGVHRIGVVILLEREALEVLVTFGKADAVGGLAGGDHDLADTEFRCGLDYIIGADRVDAEGLVVRLDQYPRDRCKMHHGVRRRRRPAGLEAVEAEMGRQGIEGLAVIRQIGDQRIDAGMIERFEVDIEQLITLAFQVRQDMRSGRHIAAKAALVLGLLVWGAVGSSGVIVTATAAQPGTLTKKQSDALETYTSAVRNFELVLGQRRAQLDSRQPLPNLPGQALYLARNAMRTTLSLAVSGSSRSGTSFSQPRPTTMSLRAQRSNPFFPRAEILIASLRSQ